MQVVYPVTDQIAYESAWTELAKEAGEFVPDLPTASTPLWDVWRPMFRAIARANGAGEWGAQMVAEKVMGQYATVAVTAESCAEVIATIKALVRA